MGLHATREERGRPSAARQGARRPATRSCARALRVGQPNYSIKSIETFYMDERATRRWPRAATRSSRSSGTWRPATSSLLEEIERYNEDDCRSHASAARMAARPARRGDRAVRIRDPVAGAARVVGAGRRGSRRSSTRCTPGFTDGVPDDAVDQDDDQHARWLMAQLLDYHRREAKPAWWAYFERLEADEEQLTEVDTEALGGLSRQRSAPVPLPAPSRSVHPHAPLPRRRSTRSRPAASSIPRPRRGLTVESIDNATGTLRISRASLPCRRAASTRAHPRRAVSALTPSAALCVGSQATSSSAGSTLRALQRAASDPARERSRARRRAHVAEALQAGAFDLEDAKRIAEGLRRQLPLHPGAARLGQDLHRRAPDPAPDPNRASASASPSNSHKAIHNLLAEVEKCAAPDEPFAGLKKCCSDDEQPLRVQARADRELRGRWPTAPAAATSSWPAPPGCSAARSWTGRSTTCSSTRPARSRSPTRSRWARARATSSCSATRSSSRRSSQALHPPGAGVSVLEHLLDGARDDPARARPLPRRDLADAPGRVPVHLGGDLRGPPRVRRGLRQRSASTPLGELTGPASGSCRSTTRATARSRRRRRRRSPDLVEELLEGQYDERRTELATPFDRRGDHGRRALQRAGALPARARCPTGSRVGTVDKFQGQEAAVCFFSMATSSGEEIPRNLEFLFSRNRLNVAISRARCLAVLVCNPALLHIRCRNAEQMRLVNALCWFVEMAGEQPDDQPSTP